MQFIKPFADRMRYKRPLLCSVLFLPLHVTRCTMTHCMSHCTYSTSEKKKVIKQKKGAGEQRAPGLTMSVVVQSRAVSQMEKPWKLMESRLKSLKLYLGELCRRLECLHQNKEDIETRLRNTIVLIPKKKVVEVLEGQTRCIGVQSVLLWMSY